jgi:hypothetical protein
MTTIHHPDLPPILAKYDFAIECHERNPHYLKDAQEQGYSEYLMAGKIAVMQGWRPKP